MLDHGEKFTAWHSVSKCVNKRSWKESNDSWFLPDLNIYLILGGDK